MPPPRRQFSLAHAAPRWWLVLAFLTVVSLRSYCGTGELTSIPRRGFSGSTMGTTYSVLLGQAVSQARQEALEGAANVLLGEINASMSTYDPDSELSRFNRHGSTEPFPLSAQLAEVVRLALSVSRASSGTFDVTVGPLVDAWGFGPEPRPERALDDQELQLLRERVGYEKLTLAGRMLRKAHPQLRVDLSAIAKGYAVDRLALLLDGHGYRDYLVEIGGELRARGRNAQGQPFRVGIEQPVVGRRAIHSTIALENASLATSGNYRNYFDRAGQRYSHTIDPTTGRPVRHRLLSASVVHAECALADAWATALMVAGPDRALQLARDQELDVLLLVAGEGAELLERATPGFLARRP